MRRAVGVVVDKDRIGAGRQPQWQDRRDAAGGRDGERRLLQQAQLRCRGRRGRGGEEVKGGREGKAKGEAEEGRQREGEEGRPEGEEGRVRDGEGGGLACSAMLMLRKVVVLAKTVGKALITACSTSRMPRMRRRPEGCG